MRKFKWMFKALAASVILLLFTSTDAWALCLCQGCTYERCMQFCVGQTQWCNNIPREPPPDDDDKPEPADVALTVRPRISQSDWYSGRVFATYSVTLTNNGDDKAGDVQLVATLPPFMMVLRTTDTRCSLPGFTESPPEPGITLRKGGQVSCKFGELRGGGSVRFDIEARILNATDLHALQEGVELQSVGNAPRGVKFVASFQGASGTVKQEELAKVDIPFLGGSYDGTRAAMQALAEHFNYEAANLAQGCNQYKEDIYDRLEQIHKAHPQVFRDISYGGVTSGGYTMVTGGTAGHVGVVVYMKGTNYRDTGIIIHGTPSPSPLTLYANQHETQIGDNPIGGGLGRLGWTALDRLYNRTPANRFPGLPQEESRGGFEGMYVDNGQEFTAGNAGPAPVIDVPDAGTCPFAPEAVVLTTASPVELLVTNARGQRVQTQGNSIVLQELGSNIFSMAFPHADGSYGWTLVLPRDDYEVQLTGTRTGAYTLTRTTFTAQGEPVDVVTEGFTDAGRVDKYTVRGSSPARSGNGGGGALDLPLLLLSLLLLAGCAARSGRQ